MHFLKFVADTERFRNSFSFLFFSVLSIVNLSMNPPFTPLTPFMIRAGSTVEVTLYFHPAARWCFVFLVYP